MSVEAIKYSPCNVSPDPIGELVGVDLACRFVVCGIVNNRWDMGRLDQTSFGSDYLGGHSGSFEGARSANGVASCSRTAISEALVSGLN